MEITGSSKPCCRIALYCIEGIGSMYDLEESVTSLKSSLQLLLCFSPPLPAIGRAFAYHSQLSGKKGPCCCGLIAFIGFWLQISEAQSDEVEPRTQTPMGAGVDMMVVVGCGTS